MIKYIAVIILSASTFVSTPYRYFQSRQLQKTANTLAIQNKYSEALKKYEEAQKVWSSEDINTKIQDTKETLENYNYYQEGSRFIDSKMWDEAIISLSKVHSPSKYFDTAQSLLDYAKGKIGEKKEKETPEVKGASTNSSADNHIEKISNPTPIPEIVIPTSAPLPSSIPTPDESALKQSIKTAFSKVAGIEMQLYLLSTTLTEYSQGLADCLKSARTPKSDAILSPDQYRSLEQNCKNLYQNNIGTISNQISGLQYQKEEYSRQVNELMSRCTTCN